MQFQFVIPGRIGGKGRPKFARRGNFVTAYTPAKTRSTEAMVRDMGLQAMGTRPPLTGAVWLEIELTLIPPASWPRKRRATASYVTGKPDLDNILKLIGDALNGVCWVDDSLIAKVSFVRKYEEFKAESVTVKFGDLAVASLLEAVSA